MGLGFEVWGLKLPEDFLFNPGNAENYEFMPWIFTNASGNPKPQTHLTQHPSTNQTIFKLCCNLVTANDTLIAAKLVCRLLQKFKIWNKRFLT